VSPATRTTFIVTSHSKIPCQVHCSERVRGMRMKRWINFASAGDWQHALLGAGLGACLWACLGGGCAHLHRLCAPDRRSKAHEQRLHPGICSVEQRNKLEVIGGYNMA
jgi:hypothetical protein